MAAEQFTINCLAAFPTTSQVVEFFVKDFIGGLQKKADQKFPGELKLVMKGLLKVVMEKAPEETRKMMEYFNRKP